MFDELPERVTALLESHVLVGDAIEALESVEVDAQFRLLLDALQVVYDNQAALIEGWSSSQRAVGQPALVRVTLCRSRPAAGL